MDDIAPRVERIGASLTLQMSAEAAAEQKAGADVVCLGAGEPDFDTPDHIKRAAKQAIDAGETGYTAPAGRDELKGAIRDKLKRENSLEFQADEIIVTCGAKQALYDLCQDLLQLGDEAIIPCPYWVSYPAMTKLAGADPVYVKTQMDNGFRIDPDCLDSAFNGSTRLVFLNSPNNPTGQVYTESELMALGEVLEAHPRTYVVTDDIYEHLRWDGTPFCNILNVCPELRERCIVVNGVSKAYAMTGWRIGYAAGPKHVIEPMGKVQGQSTAGAATPSQHAAEAALNGDQSMVRKMASAYRERHDFVLGALNELPGVECRASQGTFYSFPNCREAMERLSIDKDTDLAEQLLHQYKVALVPGSAFGAPGHLRLSFAADMNTLEEGMDRLRSFFSKVTPSTARSASAQRQHVSVD